MKIQPTRPNAPALPTSPVGGAAPVPDSNPGPRESLSLGGPSNPAPRPPEEPAPAPARPLAETAKDTALAASPGFWAGLLGHVKGIGLALHDWVTGEAAACAQAHKLEQGVLALEKPMAALSDVQLREKTTEFRARLTAGASLDDLAVEAFAVAREAARRATGLTAHKEQILGGAYAHQGGVVELKTGEGKTLMEVMPAYLHALGGGGVHIMTANDYLAQRDRNWMGPVFERLGMTVGVVSRDLDDMTRLQANQADVTYGTAAEFGFQYLTDHLAENPQQRVSRDLSQVYVLVDEADKVLLDESNTPLVIADRVPEDTGPARVMAAVVQHLHKGADIKTDDKLRRAWLTEAGLEKAEKLLGMGDLYSSKNDWVIPYLDAAVQARGIYQNGVDYVNRNGEIVLVDSFTGRLKEGHRFAEGLHQAIEAAEGVEVGDAQKTMASITFPNFFRLYGRVAGMTGTAREAKEEFAEVFGLATRLVDPHRPVLRKDLDDRLFADSASRDAALLAEVERLHQEGRPILLGTRTIERSEELSQKLAALGIPHNVLNARNPEAEAAIVAQAGRLGAVTIATNIAGRGTDIKLGGDADGLPPEQRDACAAEKARVLALGGLAVLGSERHEARRVDQQLAGRAGRQGDPGSSQFFVSADDEVMKLYGGEPPRQQSGSKVNDWIRAAQKHSEDRSLENRRYQLKFDGVVNLQRRAVYAERDAVLEGADPNLAMPEMLDRAVRLASEEGDKQAERTAYLLGSAAQPGADLQQQLESALEAQKARMGPGYPFMLRQMYLEALDAEWSEQIDVLNALRDGNGLKGMNEENPELIYQKDAHEAYEQMQSRVSARVLHALLSARPLPPPELQANQVVDGQEGGDQNGADHEPHRG